jgi:mannosyltransferase OCH1-like enzyme
MIVIPRVGLRKLVRLALPALFVLFVLHQLSYTDDVTFASRLPESMNIIHECTLSDLELLNSSRANAELGIPRLVHQIWKTDDVQTYSTELQPSYESWVAMFEPFNYTVKLWTDDDILQIIRTKYAWLLSTYESYRWSIQRADVARLIVVHAEGGIYADLDAYPSSAQQVLCLRHLGLQAVFSTTAGTIGLSNHFFMAKRGSPYLQWALCEAKRRAGLAPRRILLPYLQVFWSTGPIMMTSSFREYIWLFGTLPHDFGLLGEDYSGAVIHHAAGRSWHGSDGQILNYIADHASINNLLVVLILLGTVLGLVWVIKRRGGIFLVSICRRF